MGTLRLSVGRGNTAAEIDAAVEIIASTQRRAPQAPVFKAAAPAPSAILTAAAPAPSAILTATTPAQAAPAPETAKSAPAAPRSTLEAAPIQLTRYTHGLGCACKLRPQDLERVLARLPIPTQPELTQGLGDDAAIWQLDAATALVLTADFFTPILDDPHDFGAVAAANALSDVYAMGARPLCALNLVGFPVGRLPLSALEAILAGAAAAAGGVGVPLVGGHTIDSPEPLFGLAVLGQVHPDRVWRKAGARPGDGIVLTKPLGTGVLSTALKQGQLDKAGAARLTAQLKQINHAAAAIAGGFQINAATDITGFGLLGHLREALIASAVAARIEVSAVPLMLGALALAEAGVIPGGTRQNLEHVRPHVTFKGVVEPLRHLLADAQTSGGLLLISPHAAALTRALRAGGVEAALIGQIHEGAGEIEVR
ncbi:selenide, water dikinase SelD [Myxococcota bacterium]|nr:selenide, water dikinase SelD [Myxococcota bacterium]